MVPGKMASRALSTVRQVGFGLGGTNRGKAPNTGPKTVVWQLAPPTGVADGAVIEHAAENVNEQSDDQDEAEDATRTNTARLMRFGVGASVNRTRFEEICALVRIGTDERDTGRAYAGIAIAVEGDGCRFPSRAVLRLLFLGIVGFIVVDTIVGVIGRSHGMILVILGPDGVLRFIGVSFVPPSFGGFLPAAW